MLPAGPPTEERGEAVRAARAAASSRAPQRKRLTHIPKRNSLTSAGAGCRNRAGSNANGKRQRRAAGLRCALDGWNASWHQSVNQLAECSLR